MLTTGSEIETGDIIEDMHSGVRYLLLDLNEEWWENTKEWKATYNALSLEDGSIEKFDSYMMHYYFFKVA
jgi:hypothetical protein